MWLGKGLSQIPKDCESQIKKFKYIKALKNFPNGLDHVFYFLLTPSPIVTTISLPHSEHLINAHLSNEWCREPLVNCAWTKMVLKPLGRKVGYLELPAITLLLWECLVHVAFYPAPSQLQPRNERRWGDPLEPHNLSERGVVCQNANHPVYCKTKKQASP